MSWAVCLQPKYLVTLIVSLSTEVIDILCELKESNGNGSLVFPSRNDRRKCISEDTLLYALFQMVAHSWFQNSNEPVSIQLPFLPNTRG